MQEVGDDEARTAECRITGSDGSRHHAQDGKDAAQKAQPVLGDLGHHRGGRGRKVRAHGSRAAVEEEPGAHRRPDKSHQALRNHGAIEHGPAHFLITDTTGHERALRGVEAGNGAARNGNEKAREDGLSLEAGLLRPAAQAIPELRQRGPLHKQAHHEGGRHKEKGHREERIHPADELVDGQKRRYYIIYKDNTHPQHDGPAGAVTGNISEDKGRAVDENRSHQKKQHDAEHQHHLFGTLSQVVSHQFREAGAPVPDREHAAHVVVHGAGKDASEHNPEVAGRAKLGTHDGTEDRARSRNVEELDHVHLPAGHGNEVHAVGLGDGRGGPMGIGAEDAVYEGSVNEIAQDKGHDADKKRKHYSKKLKCTLP